jgi:RNA polymerase sigma-70 factor (ECF subfamily)
MNSPGPCWRGTRDSDVGAVVSRSRCRRITRGELTTRTMTTHPDHRQDVPMATTVDHLADRDSPRASRTPMLTARFVNEALPYLNQLNDRARRMTHNAVDAEDLLQETMLRAYAGFNSFSDGTNLRAWLFRIMTDTYINGLRRARHRPSEYLTDHITDRQLAAQDRHSSQGPRSAELHALDALVTLPVQFRLAVYQGTVSLRLHRGRQRLRNLLRTTHGSA